MYLVLFFFNDTATTEIYTLSLHDALPIWYPGPGLEGRSQPAARRVGRRAAAWERLPEHRGGGGTRPTRSAARSEEHTSELQSQSNLVCRLLLEKKKKTSHLTHILLKPEHPEPYCW